MKERCENGGADVVIEAAGADTTFRLAWECARPNGIVTVVALYESAQTLPLPEMYGKNLTFKTGGVDGCDCDETLRAQTVVRENNLKLINEVLESNIDDLCEKVITSSGDEYQGYILNQTLGDEVLFFSIISTRTDSTYTGAPLFVEQMLLQFRFLRKAQKLFPLLIVF